MSREIKFRVWCKSSDRFELDNKMCYFIIGNLCNPEEKNNENYVVQQYTGLKDKNGIDIYEGDIVTYTCNNGITYKAPIVFSPTSLGYVLDISGRHLFDDKYGDYLFVYKDLEYEVVGNIFENPELLKQ